jgi:hypothetical protein
MFKWTLWASCIPWFSLYQDKFLIRVKVASYALKRLFSNLFFNFLFTNFGKTWCDDKYHRAYLHSMDDCPGPRSPKLQSSMQLQVDNRSQTMCHFLG